MRPPAYEDPNVRLYASDALDMLAEMEPESVHCIVTSPPYYGLRKYAGEQERAWGGLEECLSGVAGGGEHDWGSPIVSKASLDESFKSWANRASDGLPPPQADHIAVGQGSLCQLCGAWKGALGQEGLHDCLGWARGERCNVCYICADAETEVLTEHGWASHTRGCYERRRSHL